MCDIGVSKISVSVMTTTSADDSLTVVMHGSNQPLHNTLRNVLPLMPQCRMGLRRCRGGGFPGVHADPVHSMDVLFSLNPANEQAKALQKLSTNTCKIWSGVVMLKHAVDVHVRNATMLLDLVSIPDTCHIHKSHHQNSRLVACIWHACEYNVPLDVYRHVCLHQHVTG